MNIKILIILMALVLIIGGVIFLQLQSRKEMISPEKGVAEEERVKEGEKIIEEETETFKCGKIECVEKGPHFDDEYGSSNWTDAQTECICQYYTPEDWVLTYCALTPPAEEEIQMWRDCGVSLEGPPSEGYETKFLEQFTRWLSSPFTGIASAPFVINDTDPALGGARGLVINEAETTAYIIGEFSAELSKVDIDPNSPSFGQVTVITTDLLRLNGLAVNRAETVAYVTTEVGYDRTGANRLVQVDLTTGEAVTLNAQMGQPTNIALSQDETEGYVMDLQWGGLYRMDLETGGITPIATGLNHPYPVAVNQAETLAYVVTEPARPGDYPMGDLLGIDLQTGQVSTVAAEAIFGATSISLSADERLAFVTEFGHEGGCDGRLSVVNVDPSSTDFGKKTVLVAGLCGAHDVKPNRAETLIYFVEVDSSRFSVIRVNLDRLNW